MNEKALEAQTHSIPGHVVLGLEAACCFDKHCLSVSRTVSDAAAWSFSAVHIGNTESFLKGKQIKIDI